MGKQTIHQLFKNVTETGSQQRSKVTHLSVFVFQSWPWTHLRASWQVRHQNTSVASADVSSDVQRVVPTVRHPSSSESRRFKEFVFAVQVQWTRRTSSSGRLSSCEYTVSMETHVWVIFGCLYLFWSVIVYVSVITGLSQPLYSVQFTSTGLQLL